jgi:ABC-type lipoprotein release transport system permease subunit
MAAALAAYWPGYAVEPATVALGLGLATVIGLVAGIAPALRARRLGVTEALSATD